ncbi:cupin domain-containing protein [Rhodococcus sp. IEGM 1381]|uniref:cupin domain-containing protein n=1 Tax=Rhodococcus sp. IEGM 1381 TaxID=3047085 RepID=UPI0024B81BEC|nr:cupin domain-containing protein [Rhodococcus sp. IEGM 1381]MDI9894024.1 cupin domain-containing protein [Rhodococcus sp. IEGM 1381]
MIRPSIDPIAFDTAAIPWDAFHDDGTRSATLAGTRDPGIMFSYAFFVPAGVFDAAHSHSADVHLVVAAGELRLGYGTALDVSATRRFPQGSFLLVPAGAAHFDGADEDTILIGTAIGPWTTEYLEKSP